MLLLVVMVSTTNRICLASHGNGPALVSSIVVVVVGVQVAAGRRHRIIQTLRRPKVHRPSGQDGGVAIQLAQLLLDGGLLVTFLFGPQFALLGFLPQFVGDFDAALPIAVLGHLIIIIIIYLLVVN